MLACSMGDLGHLAVEQRRDEGIEFGGRIDAAVQHGVVVRGVGLVKAGQVARERINGRGLVAPHEVLVQRLQHKLAGAAAVGLGGRLAHAVAFEPGARLLGGA